MAHDAAKISKVLGLVCKILELIFSIVMWVIYADHLHFVGFPNVDSYHLGLVTSGAYTIICSALIILYGFNVPHDFYELIVLPVGAVLNETVFIVGLIYYVDVHDKIPISTVGTLIVSIMAGICSIIMILDCIREAFCIVIWSLYANRQFGVAFSNDDWLYLGLITSGGYTIICGTLIVCYLANERHSLHELILLPIGASLSLAVGVAGTVYYAKYPIKRNVTGTLIVTIMAFGCCITMVLDFLRELRFRNEEPTHGKNDERD